MSEDYQKNISFFKQVIDFSPACIVVTDFEGTIIYLSKSVLGMFGHHTYEEVKGRSIFTWIAPEQHNIVKENLADILKGRVFFKNQYLLLHKNRQRFWGEIRSKIITNERGEKQFLVFSINDITQEKENVDFLKDSEEQFRQLAENIEDVFILRNRFSVFYINPAFKNIFGRDSKLFYANPDIIYQWIFPDDRKEFKRTYQNYFRTPENKIRLKFRITLSGNKIKWLWMRSFPIFDQQNNYEKTVILITDISQQVEAEHKKEKIQKQLTSIIENTDDLILFSDKEGRAIIFNRAYAQFIKKFFNKTVEKGFQFDKILHREQQEKWHKAIAKVLDRQKIKKTCIFTCNKGKKHYYEVQVTPIIQNNEVIGYSEFSREITQNEELRVKEKTLLKQLKYLQNSSQELNLLSENEDILKLLGTKLGELYPDLIIVINKYKPKNNLFKTKYVWGIPENIKNITSETLIDKEYFVTPEIYRKLLDGKIHLLSKEIDELLNYTISDNTKIDIILTIKQIYIIGLVEHDKLLASICFVVPQESNNINNLSIIEALVREFSLKLQTQTSRKKLEIAKKQLKKSYGLQTDFLTNISHQILTPMTSITGFSELLKQDSIALEKQKEYIKIIKTNINEFIHTINEIIDIAKISSHQIQVVKKLFSLESFMQELFDTLKYKHKKNEDIDFSLTIDYQRNDTCYTDNFLITEIFNHLINNSIKFTQQGKIEIGYEVQKNDYLFFVTDTGIGIEKQNYNSVFDLFWQVDSSSTKRYAGAGLGLSIVKGFVELLGGKIWVKSKINHGSTFYFTIPKNPQL